MGDGWSRSRAGGYAAQLDVFDLHLSACEGFTPKLGALLKSCVRRAAPDTKMMARSVGPLAPPCQLGPKPLDDEALASLGDVRHARSALEHLLDSHRLSCIGNGLARAAH